MTAYFGLPAGRPFSNFAASVAALESGAALIAFSQNSRALAGVVFWNCFAILSNETARFSSSDVLTLPDVADFSRQTAALGGL